MLISPKVNSDVAGREGKIWTRPSISLSFSLSHTFSITSYSFFPSLFFSLSLSLSLTNTLYSIHNLSLNLSFIIISLFPCMCFIRKVLLMFPNNILSFRVLVIIVRLYIPTFCVSMSLGIFCLFDSFCVWVNICCLCLPVTMFILHYDYLYEVGRQLVYSWVTFLELLST